MPAISKISGCNGILAIKNEGEKNLKPRYNQPYLKLTNIHKRYGDINVLNGLSLDVFPGEFIAIVGKSGCGKSTLLRLLSGLEKPDDGTILINSELLTSINKHSRMMFQDGRLLPWKNVLENVCLGLAKTDKEAALETLQHVGLKDRVNEWPANLSGGQKQRVALARALVHQPKLLLLDEPLGALDALTRLEMQQLIEEIWLNKQITSFLVTHDVEEAVALADRVILLQNGKVELDIPIPFSRPRQRNHPSFSSMVDHILNRIMGFRTEKSKTMNV